MCKNAATPVNQGNQDSKRSTKRRHSSPSSANRAKVPRSSVKLIINKSDEDEEVNYGDKGFLQVENGKLIRGRYRIIKHIGSGGFGSVYMGRVVRTKKIVAVKIARCGERCNNLSQKELEFTKATKGTSHIVNLIDHFSIRGPHGTHFVMVFEMLGPDLFSVLRESNQKELTTDRIKKFCRDILMGLDQLHNKCGIFHFDLKPENLLMNIEDEEPGQDCYNIDLSDPACPASLKIADLGQASWATEDVTRQVQNCWYRAPEVILKHPIGAPTDMWSFGSTVFEMATLHALFPCSHERCPSDYDAVAELIQYIRAKLQPDEIQKVVRMDEHDASLFSDFLLRIMKGPQDRRLTAKEALEHPFLRK